MKELRKETKLLLRQLQENVGIDFSRVGKLVKTICGIEKNLIINFVTLIPGGDKQWKK